MAVTPRGMVTGGEGEQTWYMQMVRAPGMQCCRQASARLCLTEACQKELVSTALLYPTPRGQWSGSERC
jgi:hypothetical protein